MYHLPNEDTRLILVREVVFVSDIYHVQANITLKLLDIG
jgi:hypothetical protein